MEQDLSNLNISKKYNYFIWMPYKCGSVHATNIFKKFEDDFNFTHTHEINLFDDHWNYDLISLQRNPYTRYASMYKIYVDGKEYLNPDYEKSMDRKIFISNFNQYLNNIFEGENALVNQNISKYHERTPDYFIKLEQLFEDYSKIPFVRETEFYKSGQLELECSKPRNKSKPYGVSWKELYTPQTADFVYYNMSLIFDLCGYDKNSWKS
jgi:hypothetical protein